jgi:hypothetical protein
MKLLFEQKVHHFAHFSARAISTNGTYDIGEDSFILNA